MSCGRVCIVWIDVMAPDQLLWISGALVGIGVAISSLETLAARGDYERGGIFACAVLVERARFAKTRALPVAWRRIYRPSTIQLVSVLRLLAACGLLVPGIPIWVRGLCALVALVATGLTTLFSPEGFDGSDKMAKVVLAGVATANIGFGSPMVVMWASAFIAAHACLAYGASGVAKVVSPSWRSGRALAGIVATRSFGDRRASAVLVGHPGWSRLLAWMAIAWECAVPLALLAPSWLLAALLVAGVLFHSIAARVMGLNTFFWSFVATYPAIVAINHMIRAWL